MDKVQVSVVVPAFNEEKYIQNTLSSLLPSNQKTSLNYEVILVDNNSTDKTVDIAKGFLKKMNLKIIKEEKRGRGAARARGFRESKGEIILSTDADVSLYSGWVEFMATQIKGGVIAVTTHCNINDSSALNNFFFNFSLPIFMVIYKVFFGHYWLSGYSFSIKKEVYLKSGGFNPNLHAQEDTDLSFRVAKLGKIKFLNKPILVSGRRLKQGLFGGYFDYFKSYINYIQKKNGYLDNPR